MAKRFIQILRENAKLMQPLSQEDVYKRGLNVTDIFYFLYANEGEEHELGPFHIQQMKTLIQENSPFPTDVPIRSLKDENWVNIFEHPSFSRRQMAMHESQSAEASERQLYLLIEGQKSGPYTINDIKQKMKTKSILHTSLASDDGENWVKLYEFSDFDRRNGEKGSLPFRPEENTFIRNMSDLIEQAKREGQEETLADLAAMGHIKTEGSPSIPISSELEVESAKKKKGLKQMLAPIGVAALVFAVILGGGHFALTKLAETQGKAIESAAQKADKKRSIAAEKGKIQVKAAPVPKRKRKVASPKSRNTFNKRNYDNNNIRKKLAPPIVRKPKPKSREEEEDPYQDDYNDNIDDYANNDQEREEPKKDNRDNPEFDEAYEDEEYRREDERDPERDFIDPGSEIQGYDDPDGPTSEAELFDEEEIDDNY